MTRLTTTVQVNELKQYRNRVTVLRIRSIDPDLYLAEFEADDRTLILGDPAGKPIVFRSQLAAKKPFKHLGITRTLLVHASSYDEMIGLPSAGSTALEVSILCPDDDYS